MKTPDDNRVWIDSSRESTVYSAYEDQRFYSVQYDGDSPEAVLAFAEKAREFSKWARDYSLAKQTGQPAPEVPSFVFAKEEDATCRTTSPRGTAKRGRPPKQKATEADSSNDKQPF